MSGEAIRDLRRPQVARDRENLRTIITFNGPEDEFYVLLMVEETADQLARALRAAGITGETKR